jgi:hypothetical protein
MSENKVIDPETIPLDELRALALAEAEEQEAAEIKPGVEVKAKPVKTLVVEDPDHLEIPKDEQEQDEPEEYVYTREIDLDDGSGKQVFKGKGASKEAALEELTDKLAEAQTNASKTINEFRRKNPIKPEPPKAKEWTTDEEYVIAQRLQKEPLKAFRDIFKEVTGYTPDEAQSRNQQVDELLRNQRGLTVQQNFVTTHPSYIGDAQNGARMRDWVESHNYSEFTEENLEKAYQDLKKSGLLNLKSEEADGSTEVVTKDAERIAQPEVKATQTRSLKKSSTVSTKGRPAPVVKTEPSEDDLYKMPLDKLRDLANKQLGE